METGCCLAGCLAGCMAGLPGPAKVADLWSASEILKASSVEDGFRYPKQLLNLLMKYEALKSMAM